MDETSIDFKGKSYWCWNCIDTVTRYVIDMYLSPSKDHVDGIRFFERIKQSVKDNPEVIATDGNKAYVEPLKQYYPNVTHLRIKSISLKPNTSFIERYHGTIKNRTKTMRGFNGFVPCQNWLTLFQIYYNFLRPHMALNNETPAQRAGIDLDLPQRWISLVKYSSLIC